MDAWIEIFHPYSLPPPLPAAFRMDAWIEMCSSVPRFFMIKPHSVWMRELKCLPPERGQAGGVAAFCVDAWIEIYRERLRNYRNPRRIPRGRENWNVAIDREGHAAFCVDAGIEIGQPVHREAGSERRFSRGCVNWNLSPSITWGDEWGRILRELKLIWTCPIRFNFYGHCLCEWRCELKYYPDNLGAIALHHLW